MKIIIKLNKNFIYTLFIIYYYGFSKYLIYKQFKI